MLFEVKNQHKKVAFYGSNLVLLKQPFGKAFEMARTFTTSVSSISISLLKSFMKRF